MPKVSLLVPLVKGSDALFHLKRPENAHLLDRNVDCVRVAHPFHPFHDQELEIVDRRHFRDGKYVYVDVGNGKVVRLPEVWTSLGPIDPFIAISAGRSFFLVGDLRRLSRLVAEILRENRISISKGGNDAV